MTRLREETMQLLGLTLQSCVSGLLFPCKTLSQSLCRGRTHRRTHEHHKLALDAPVASVVDAGLSANGCAEEAVLCQVFLSSDDIWPPGERFDCHLVPVGLRWCFI